MKKLLSFTLATLLACAINAAQFNWGIAGGEYYDQNGDELYTGTAFLYLGTVTASDTAFEVGTATFLASSGFDSVNWAYGNVATEANDLSSNDSLLSTAANQAYTLILLNKSDVTSLDGYEGFYTLITGTSAEEVLPGATNTKYASFVNYDAPISTTTEMGAVPEPTSGLLMLLGMAGLALKRKRA